jgi:hypothetical protein
VVRVVPVTTRKILFHSDCFTLDPLPFIKTDVSNVWKKVISTNRGTNYLIFLFIHLGGFAMKKLLTALSISGLLVVAACGTETDVEEDHRDVNIEINEEDNNSLDGLNDNDTNG